MEQAYFSLHDEGRRVYDVHVKNSDECHRDDGVVHFSLESIHDVRGRMQCKFSWKVQDGGSDSS